MGNKRRADERRRHERPGIEQASGAAETPESFTGAPDAVQHPGAGAGTFPDAADNETSGMNTSTGRVTAPGRPAMRTPRAVRSASLPLGRAARTTPTPDTRAR